MGENKSATLESDPDRPSFGHEYLDHTVRPTCQTFTLFVIGLFNDPPSSEIH